MAIPNATISWVTITDHTRLKPDPNQNPTVPTSNLGNLSVVVFFNGSSDPVQITGENEWENFFGATGMITIQPGQCWAMSLLPKSVPLNKEIRIPYALNDKNSCDDPTFIVVKGG